MLFRLMLLLICMPLIELWLLLRVGDRIGSGNTFLLVIITGFIGANLARQQGLRAWHDARQQSAQGQIPAAALADGVMILISGVLLMTPGIITDGIGFLLLFPPFRQAVRLHLSSRFRMQTHMHGGIFGNTSGWTASGRDRNSPPHSAEPGSSLPPEVIDVDPSES